MSSAPTRTSLLVAVHDDDGNNDNQQQAGRHGRSHLDELIAEELVDAIS